MKYYIISCRWCSLEIKSTSTARMQYCDACATIKDEGKRKCVDCGHVYGWYRNPRCSACRWGKAKAAAAKAGKVCTQCDKPAIARGLCGTHYSYKHRETNPRNAEREREARRANPHEKVCEFCNAEFKTIDYRSRCCSGVCAQRLKWGWSTSRELMPYNERLNGDIGALQYLITANAEDEARRRRRDLRSPLRKAYEDGDMPGLIAAIRTDAKVTPGGCWEWQRQMSREGYGKIKFAGKTHSVHRLAALARYGQPEDEPVVHHVCANRKCCNPDHLQPVTHRENIAEMLERNYYLSRIANLEAELMKLDPSNPMINGYKLERMR